MGLASAYLGGGYVSLRFSFEGVHRVTNYQFYLLDRLGRTARPPRIVPFENDAAALAEARKTIEDRTIEIWQGDRCVATLLQTQYT
jgi:hypothetical protein